MTLKSHSIEVIEINSSPEDNYTTTTSNQVITAINNNQPKKKSDCMKNTILEYESPEALKEDSLNNIYWKRDKRKYKSERTRLEVTEKTKQSIQRTVKKAILLGTKLKANNHLLLDKKKCRNSQSKEEKRGTTGNKRVKISPPIENKEDIYLPKPILNKKELLKINRNRKYNMEFNEFNRNNSTPINNNQNGLLPKFDSITQDLKEMEASLLEKLLKESVLSNCKQINNIGNNDINIDTIDNDNSTIDNIEYNNKENENKVTNKIQYLKPMNKLDEDELLYQLNINELKNSKINLNRNKNNIELSEEFFCISSDDDATTNWLTQVDSYNGKNSKDEKDNERKSEELIRKQSLTEKVRLELSTVKIIKEKERDGNKISINREYSIGDRDSISSVNSKHNRSSVNNVTSISNKNSINRGYNVNNRNSIGSSINNENSNNNTSINNITIGSDDLLSSDDDALTIFLSQVDNDIIMNKNKNSTIGSFIQNKESDNNINRTNLLKCDLNDNKILKSKSNSVTNNSTNNNIRRNGGENSMVNNGRLNRSGLSNNNMNNNLINNTVNNNMINSINNTSLVNNSFSINNNDANNNKINSANNTQSINTTFLLDSSSEDEAFLANISKFDPPINSNSNTNDNNDNKQDDQVNKKLKVERRKEFIKLDLIVTEYYNLINKDSKIIFGKQNSKEGLIEIELQQEWKQLNIKTGDQILIHVEKNQHHFYIINNDKNNKNYLILFPKLLINTTHLADAFSCSRRSLLTIKVYQLETNKKQIYSMLMGILLHDVLQTCLKYQKFQEEEIQLIMKICVQNKQLEIILNNFSENEIYLELLKQVGRFLNFFKNYLGDGENSVGIKLSTDNVLVEESIVSMQLGLKGKVDIILNVNENKKENKIVKYFNMSKGITDRNIASRLPIEFKTGKNKVSINHQAQLLLYQLLMNEIKEDNKEEINQGYLYYFNEKEKEEMKLINYNFEEIKLILFKRNELIVKLKQWDGKNENINFGNLLNNKFNCQNCSLNQTCFLYYKIEDNNNNNNNEIKDEGLIELMENQLNHLKKKEMKFFNYWNLFINLEEGQLLNEKYQFIKGEEFNSIDGILINKINVLNCETINSNKNSYNKIKNNDDIEDIILPNQQEYLITIKNQIKDKEIEIGESILLQDEFQKLTFMGNIRNINEKEIQIQIEKDIMNFKDIKLKMIKNENVSYFHLLRSNLIGLLMGHEDNLIKLRDLIIYEEENDNRSDNNNIKDLILNNNNSMVNNNNNNIDINYIDQIISELPIQLNTDQYNGLIKILNMKQYYLIIGMPGTGKSTWISIVIYILIKLNKNTKILITSHTNSAVDGILKKLHRLNVKGILRLGNESKMDLEVIKYSFNNKALEEGSIRKVLESTRIIISTCIGLKDKIINYFQFNYCILDEATQINLPLSLGGLLKSDKFLLIGDPYQLPPIVRNIKAKKKGMEMSLFHWLLKKEKNEGVREDEKGDNVIMLSYQYRMNLGIMKLTNSLTYEGKLKCNNKKVLEAKLELIDQNKEWDKEVECELINSNNTLIKLPNEHSVCSKKCLISRVFDSNQSVIFLNTDQFLNCQESKKKKSIINKVEIKIIIILLLELKKQNFNFNNLALLSIYKAQLAAISSQLLSRNLEIKNLFTIDKVQGLEFDLILFSAVRNNDTEELGFLLKDWRRINVALTRAKKKLIIIGSKRTLKGDKKLKEFLEFCKLEGALIG